MGVSSDCTTPGLSMGAHRGTSLRLGCLAFHLPSFTSPHRDTEREAKRLRLMGTDGMKWDAIIPWKKIADYFP
jgi:hypothetical protein